MIRYILLLFWFFPLVTKAGEKVLGISERGTVLRLSSAGAIQAALAKNFSIEVQRFGPRIAAANLVKAGGRFDPILELNVQRDENSQAEALVSGALTPVRALSRLDNLSVGIRGTSAIGFEYDLGLGARNNLGIFNQFENAIGTTASLAVRQPLLRGFGPASNLAEVRISRNNLLVSEWSLKAMIIDIITRTIFVYNELHLAKELLRVAERSRELARQLLVDNEARERIGVMSPLDIAEARAEVAAREDGVILAGRAILDNENFLKQLVTNDLEKILKVRVEIDAPPSPAFRVDVGAGIREALILRPDYQQALLEIRQRNITLAYTTNRALPRFDLLGSLALLGFGNDYEGSLRRVGVADQTAWTVGGIVSIPIPNREGRGAANAAKLECGKALVALQELEQKMVVDVDNASGRVVTSRERIGSTAEAVRLAKKSLEAGEERLRTGTGTTFEVLGLQKKLIEVEAGLLRARAGYNQAVSEYQRQTGTTLRENAVILR
ncbi:MAG: TolC family protein [Verrucomicrobiota bacterium]